jgi:hypothetical protein
MRRSSCHRLQHDDAPASGLRHDQHMDLLVPQHVIDQMTAAQKQAWQDTADELTRRLLDDIDARVPRMVEVPNEDGARVMTATIFLVRAVELLREIHDADGQMLRILGLRSAFELALVARFLLDHPDGPDEFRRLFHRDMNSEISLAQYFDYEPAPAPAFLQHLMDTEQKGPRDLRSLAAAIDELDGRDSSKRYSAVHTWQLTHKFVSQSAVHANAVSIKRFTTGEGGVLGVKPDPPPVYEDPPDLLVTCFVADLARSVYGRHNLPKDHLPDEIRRPGEDEGTD